MSRTPYFDEYEATRRNSTVPLNGIRFGDVANLNFGQVLPTNLAGNLSWAPITSGVTIEFPSYRIVKQYNDQGIVSDFTIEMRQDTNAEWTPIPEVVRYA